MVLLRLSHRLIRAGSLLRFTGIAGLLPVCCVVFVCV